MKKELKQLNRVTFWLSQAIRAKELEKGAIWDANNTFPAANFLSFRNNYLAIAGRYKSLSEYCYQRYLAALETFNQLTPVLR